jgi:hypothetical protein
MCADSNALQGVGETSPLKSKDPYEVPRHAKSRKALKQPIKSEVSGKRTASAGLWLEN